ncbi:hypothetical protein B566_EDAN007361 [Ephemera danica]|nr:hypothetical protein B566_EDAN007361 [Ephemera danica]
MMVKPNVYPAVLDERWNEFPTIFTAGSVEFSKPIFFTTDRIHLSVLARSDAHIALHSSSSPYNSSTYWISLDENVDSVSRSSIRKCLRGLPRSLLPRFADCLLIRAGHQGLDVLRSGTEWVHFTIQLIKEEQSLTIKVKKAHTKDNTAHILSTLTWTDTNPIRDFRYISFRTKDTPGRWKVHDYRLVIHNGKADGDGFNVFQLSQPYQCCLQVYYFFRPDMGTAVVSSKDGKQVINLPPTNGTWRTTKVDMAMSPPSDHIHFKPPLGNFEATGPAFAISQPFRICGDEEIPSDVAEVPSSVTEVQEVDSYEDSYDDGEGGDEAPTPVSPNAGAEAAQKCAEGSCNPPSMKNTPLIVVSVLMSLILVGAVLGAWVWFRRTRNPVTHAIGIRWKGGNRLIGEEEDERA